MGSFSVWHWLVLIVVCVLIFSPAFRRLGRVGSVANHDPGLARSWSLALPRGEADTYTRAEKLRDSITARFRALPATAGLALTSYDSSRGSGDVWTRLEYVRPEPGHTELSLRTVIAITIDRMDFHRYEHVIRIDVGRGTLRRGVTDLIELLDEDVAALGAFAAGTRKTFPSLVSRRQRHVGWQFWRPSNRIERLRPDKLGAALMMGGVVALVLGGTLVMAPAHGGDEGCYGDDCTSGGDGSIGMLVLLAGAGLVAAQVVIATRRPTLVLNAGKPLSEPVSLVRMDSWQTTVGALGSRRGAVEAALMARLAHARPDGVSLREEHIGYASPDGKVVRMQRIVGFRRAVAYIHLETYGDDLYVGWDSHINGATWCEDDIAHGLDRRTGRSVVARRVVKGWQQPNEYDVTDANFLTEWVHAAIVSVVKLQMAEHDIDQDIDFTIQRESRAAALRAQDPQAGVGTLARGMLKRRA